MASSEDLGGHHLLGLLPIPLDQDTELSGFDREEIRRLMRANEAVLILFRRGSEL